MSVVALWLSPNQAGEASRAQKEQINSDIQEEAVSKSNCSSRQGLVIDSSSQAFPWGGRAPSIGAQGLAGICSIAS